MYYDYIYSNLKDIIDKKDKVYLKNQNSNFMFNMILSDYLHSNKNIIVVLPNLYEAQKCYDLFSNIIDDSDVLFFPQDELIAAEMIDVSGDFKYERINTIISLINTKKKYIVITNINGAIKEEFSLKTWKESTIDIDKNTIINETLLFESLEKIGYTFSYTVSKTGQYSHRGSIIDIFPLNYNCPIRIDLFGDEIDALKTFDPETQKSISDIESVSIIPVSEMIYSSKDASLYVDKIKSFFKNQNISLEEQEKINQDITNLMTKNKVDNLLRYVNFFDDSMTIFDFVSDKKVYLVDYKKCEDNYNHMIEDLKMYCESINGYSLFKLQYFKDFNYVKNNSDVLSEGVVNVFDNGIDYLVTILEDLKASKNDIIKFLKDNYLKYKTIITIKNQIRLDNLKESLIDSNIYFSIINDISQIKENQINILFDTAPSFKSSLLSLLVLNESTLFDVKYNIRKPKYKSVYKNTTKVNHYDELEIGDYVVHFDYGIGKYLGLKQLEANGVKRDYINIEYADSAKLYIPLEQISSIEKYTKGEVKTVALSNLSTKKWSNSKEKVRKKIRDISQNLIALYAKRNAAVGFQFNKDNNDQVLFEADFGYELTPDQKKSIDEIKEEMESSKVMDRLVCGDVGYGKTEVALRAAFKAVQSGKQVAVLAPTTILSRQHYYTFKNRMERFGVRVDLVNRLQSTKNLKLTMEGLKTGEVDVVIGTHKLLGKDIVYHDLGLLIIDEEQRFGVTQKEKIKELKINVDTITLSATPIPRTLQMSLVGIKTLSMLETPPKNRYPVQTYVLERNDSIIRDAIMREMARNGQVFYMYNYTDDIYKIAKHINELVPDASICVGHGKMDKNELEDVITDFIDKKYDVLVCTTIIETGIDMPDANTLIIHDANKLGLSQLYQLRGRVGRSSKIAYAYLMYEPHYILTESASKRLDTIKEFNELGSGFKIAMRDLAIRGAGDLLGDEQSGFIDSIGLETYLHILDEEINKKEEPTPQEEKDPSLLKVYSSRYIPKEYIDNEDVKIEIHKRIDKITSLKELNELALELRDRFGKYGDELNVYMHEKLISKFYDKLQIKKILDTKSQMILFMSKEMSSKMDGQYMFNLANSISKDIELRYYSKQIEIVMNKGMSKNQEYLISLATFLDNLYNNL